ncbi:MAG: metallophosphoesterase family protein [Halothece sp.]
MRILHTSDWHLGHKNDSHDRTENLFQQVEYICQLTTQHQVDVLLVAGDIFARRSPELTKRLAKVIAPYVQQGLHVILVPGNHDDREYFRMMHSLLTLEQGHSDRVHIIQTRDFVTINGVQFAILPYPSRELLEPHRPDATGKTERNVVLSSAYANLVRAVVEHLDPSLPAVFVAHINVAGVTTPSNKELGYDEDIRLGRADLPIAQNLAYIALGHIHQQQQIEHSIPCWYSGNIETLDMGERNDQKGVLLVDIPDNGEATVTPLPLNVTPFYDITIPAVDLENLPDLYPNLEGAFVKIRLELQPDNDSVFLQRQARQLARKFNFLLVDVVFMGQGTSRTTTNLPDSPQDYHATVLGYLQTKYSEQPELLTELEQRAIELMREVNDATTTN